MRTFAFSESSIEALTSAIDQATQWPEMRSLLLFLAEAGPWDLEALSRWAQKPKPFPFAGGIFPHVIAGNRVLSEGGVVVALSSPIEIIRVAMREQIELPARLTEIAPETLFFMLLDGLSPYVGSLINTLYDELGLEMRYAGGGAGSLSLMQRPSLITDAGITQDEALLIARQGSNAIVVRHGWQPLVSNLIFEATQTEGNTVVSLDWEPALAVYRRLVEPVAGKEITPENFFSIAQSYPLGLIRPSGEFIVRDPIRIEGERIVCVGPIPEGSTLTILHGNPDTLLEAARDIRAKSVDAATHFTPAGRLIFDCVSRFLFMKERFAEELAELAPDDLPTAGALTLGEIAFSHSEALQFYNKTAVVALIG